MKELELVGRLLGEGHSCPNGTYSLRHSMQGGSLTLKYSTIVYFASEQSLNEQLSRQKEMAVQRMDESISNLKKSFRSESGKTLKLKNRKIYNKTRPMAYGCPPF